MGVLTAGPLANISCPRTAFVGADRCFPSPSTPMTTVLKVLCQLHKGALPSVVGSKPRLDFSSLAYNVFSKPLLLTYTVFWRTYCQSPQLQLKDLWAQSLFCRLLGDSCFLLLFLYINIFKEMEPSSVNRSPLPITRQQCPDLGPREPTCMKLDYKEHYICWFV